MAVFIANSGLISKDNSIITGSLSITNGITGSLFGTASYVITSSYSLSSATASYTLATSIDSSSYSLTTVSASLASTASTVNGLYYGPTQNIGYLSPNTYLGSCVAAGNFAVVNATTVFNGTFLTPILINKPCTLVTMSIVGGTSNNTTCSFGLYTNSTSSNLPEYLLAEGVLRSAAVTGPAIFNVSNFTPIKLQANTVYWIAFLTNAPGGNTAFKFLNGTIGQNFMSINPLLGNMMSVSASNIVYPHFCIRSGSVGVGLAVTASKDTGSYGFMASATSICILPTLKVTYP
jgi:hypothetical protein